MRSTKQKLKKLKPVLPAILFRLLYACTTAYEVGVNRDSACQCMPFWASFCFAFTNFFRGMNPMGCQGN